MQNDDIIRVALRIRDAANQPTASSDFAKGIQYAIRCTADASTSPATREILQYLAGTVWITNGKAGGITADAFVSHYWPTVPLPEDR